VRIALIRFSPISCLHLRLGEESGGNHTEVLVKRTLSLIGLLAVGLMLLFNPSTGLLVSRGEPDLVAAGTYTAEPPPSTASATFGSDPAPGSPDDTSTTGTLPSTTAPAPLEVVADGPSVSTRFGNFQVRVTVEDGSVVGIDVLQQPADRHSRAINSQVLPYYVDAALRAQSAGIDLVSGATVTWRAFTESLQGALAEAGVGTT
jgi:uncharacterized protein with FMN-binding domain